MNDTITIVLKEGRILQSTHLAQKKVNRHNASVRWWEITKKYLPETIIPTEYQKRWSTVQESADAYNSKLKQ